MLIVLVAKFVCKQCIICICMTSTMSAVRWASSSCSEQFTDKDELNEAYKLKHIHYLCPPYTQLLQAVSVDRGCQPSALCEESWPLVLTR